MKILLTVLLAFISTFCFAQQQQSLGNTNTIITAKYQFNVDSAFRGPQDTLASAPLFSKGWKSGNEYYKNAAGVWVKVSYIIGDTTMSLGNYAYNDGIFPLGKILNFFGDSWTFGTGASVTANRWSSQICSITGATEANFGVAGRSLQTNGTTNYQGILSGIQTMNTIPANTTGTAGVFVELGLNDIVNLPGYTTAHFAAAFDTLGHHIVDTLLYRRRQVVVMGIPYIPDSALNYYGVISGATPPSRARLLQFDSTLQAACLRWGFWYVPNYYVLKDNMNDTTNYVLTGHVHVDDLGHLFVANNAVQKMNFVASSPFSQSGTVVKSKTANVNLLLGDQSVTSTATPASWDLGLTSGTLTSVRQLKGWLYHDLVPANSFGFGVYSGLMGIWVGGSGAHMKVFINGDSSKPYFDFSAGSLILANASNSSAGNSILLGTHTLSVVTVPDAFDAGATVTSTPDSSKLKMYVYNQGVGGSKFGFGISSTSADAWTPFGFPLTVHYAGTLPVIIDKFLTLSNYASAGNRTIFDSTNYKLTVINQSTGKMFTTDWSNINKLAHTIFTPTTGGTVTLVNNQYNIVNPSGSLLALTITLPASPVNNDIVYIKYTQAVTTVTYSGGTVVDGITSPIAGGLVILTYDAGTTSWY